jgi:peptidoglycan/LPS O-acetylase OafA/YrhL
MNSAKFRSGSLALGSLLLAISAFAHPGHDLRDATPQHLLTSPDHLAVLALGGVALWFAGRFVQRQLPRRLLQGAGLAAVLTAALIWGVRT